MQRRSFLQIAAMTTGGVLLGIQQTGCVSLDKKIMMQMLDKDGSFSPNAFLSLKPDGRIVLALNKAEMGQGVMTGYATLVAEELEVEIGRIDVYQAYKKSFGLQSTGGSNSLSGGFLPLRQAAATVREMLRSAAAQEWGVPEQECRVEKGHIHHASGRSLSYQKLTRQAAQLPIPKNPPLKSSKDFRLIGKGVQRVDGLDKCTGRSRYGTDVDVEGKVCAYVMRSPRLGGTAKKLNADKALAQPGVLKIFPFARGVAVVARTFWQAKRAAQQVEVEWTKGITEGLHTKEVMQASQKRSRQAGMHTAKSEGNALAAMQRGDVTIVESQFDFPYLSHATMEPQNCTVAFYGDRAKIWAPTQSPTIAVDVVSQVLALPVDKIELEVMMLGGGFGRRSSMDFVVEAALVARQYPNVPVQVLWTREQDMQLGYYRPQGTCRMRGAIDKEGKIAGIHGHLVSQSTFPDFADFLTAIFPSTMPPKLRKRLGVTAHGFMSNVALLSRFETGEIANTRYDIPNMRVEYTPIFTRVPMAAWRSVAHSYSSFIMEVFFDQLAHAGKQDPLAMREALLQEHPRYLNVLRAAVEKSDWRKPIEDGWGRGFAMSEFAGTIVGLVVEAGVVENKIVVRHVTCVSECGLVVNPSIVEGQLEGGIIYALSTIDQKIELVDGIVQQRNFDRFPVLRMSQLPKFNIVLLPSDDAPRGIGEASVPPTMPALSNAIFAATGVRLTQMPLQEAWAAHATPTKAVP